MLHIEQKEKDRASETVDSSLKVQLTQIRELVERFEFQQPEHIAKVLRISNEDAEKMFIMVSTETNKNE